MTEREHMIARLKKCDSNVWGKNGLIHCITDGPIRYRRNRSGSYVKQATEKLVRTLEEMEERIVALEAENAKLRELAGEAVYLIYCESPDCGLCKYYSECWGGEAMNYSPGGCVICNKAKGMGIEFGR